MSLLRIIFLQILSLIFITSAFAFPNASTSKSYNGGRIINGTVATVNATKHQVSIRRRLQDSYFFGTGHICGGSLIAPNVVLSAAHCFVDMAFNPGTFYAPEDFIVVMGNLDRFERNNLTLIFDIERIVYNISFFNLTTFDSDIALMFLNGSVPGNHSTIQPISISRSEVPANTTCQVTGWGITEDGSSSDVLKTVDVPVIDTGVCANSSLLGAGSILPGMMCAGYMEEGQRDACNGDSGGPLVCRNNLTGIVSWGDGCALPWLPGVYTDVVFWAPWIDEQLRAENITVPGGNGGAMSNVKTSFTLLGVVICILNVLSSF